MPSKPRNFYQFGMYHIYNRGNHKLPIFRERSDYEYFLRQLAKRTQEHKVSILAFCLMRNHYHFLTQQMGEDESSITACFAGATMSYVRYFNNKYGKVGHLFQDKFKSRLIATEPDRQNIISYIHNNPSEFMNPYEYPWSSLTNSESKTHVFG